MQPFPAILRDNTRIAVVEPPWAPGLAVAFGRWVGTMVPVSPLATGKGPDRETALAGCLGEMAENLSIGVAAHPQPVLAAGMDARVIDLGSPGDAGSEGCAAHGDPATAALRAVCERIERAALALWWQGQIPAASLGADRLAEQRYRAGVALRRTRAWRLDLVPGVASVLVLTDDGTGARIALGSAAALTLDDAVEAALREALLAEIAFLAPPEHPDRRRTEALDRMLRGRLPELERAGADAGDATADGENAAAVLDRCRALGHAGAIADLTHPVLRVPVMRCVIPSWPLWRGLAL